MLVHSFLLIAIGVIVWTAGVRHLGVRSANIVKASQPPTFKAGGGAGLRRAGRPVSIADRLYFLRLEAFMAAVTYGVSYAGEQPASYAQRADHVMRNLPDDLSLTFTVEQHLRVLAAHLVRVCEVEQKLNLEPARGQQQEPTAFWSASELDRRMVAGVDRALTALEAHLR